MSARSWCLSCGDRATLVLLGYNVDPADVWECERGHRAHTRRCPLCGYLGRATRVEGRYQCTGTAAHLFWAAARFCECGAGVPVCPDDGARVWVCENDACDRWEPVVQR